MGVEDLLSANEHALCYNPMLQPNVTSHDILRCSAASIGHSKNIDVCIETFEHNYRKPQTYF